LNVASKNATISDYCPSRHKRMAMHSGTKEKGVDKEWMVSFGLLKQLYSNLGMSIVAGRDFSVDMKSDSKGNHQSENARNWAEGSSRKVYFLW